MYTKVTGAFGKPYSAIVLQRRCVRASIPESGRTAARSIGFSLLSGRLRPCRLRRVKREPCFDEPS
jgi:hypothetical protein